MAKMYGFKSGGEKPAGAFQMLPAGCYVAGIKNVKIDGEKPDRQIVLRLDIIEGEHTGYFTKRWEHDRQNAGFNQQYQAKYKGDFRIQIPDPENAMRQHPEWDVKSLNNMIWCVESSNPGFHFDGDDAHISQLKGKTVGINVREEKSVIDGKICVYTRIMKFENADDVRKGLCRTMPPKDRTGGAAAPAAAPACAPGFTPVETDELPF